MNRSRSQILNRPAFSQAWSEAWHDSGFRYHLLLVGVFALTVIVTVPDFFVYIDSRPGTLLNDPLLQWLPARDVSWLTFYLLYTSVIAAAYFLIPHPKALLKCLQVYSLVTLLRLLCIYLIPLEPPVGIIPLEDPFISYCFAGGKPVYKDLFFSGHTSTAFTLVLTAPRRWLKIALLIAAILIGTLVLVQHVHYTIDVVAAPIFTWICYRFIQRIHS